MIDKTLLLILIAPMVIGAIFYLTHNKKDKLKDWKPYD